MDLFISFMNLISDNRYWILPVITASCFLLTVKIIVTSIKEVVNTIKGK